MFLDIPNEFLFLTFQVPIDEKIGCLGVDRNSYRNAEKGDTSFVEPVFVGFSFPFLKKISECFASVSITVYFSR